MVGDCPVCGSAATEEEIGRWSGSVGNESRVWGETAAGISLRPHLQWFHVAAAPLISSLAFVCISGFRRRRRPGWRKPRSAERPATPPRPRLAPRPRSPWCCRFYWPPLPPLFCRRCCNCCGRERPSFLSSRTPHVNVASFLPGPASLFRADLCPPRALYGSWFIYYVVLGSYYVVLGSYQAFARRLAARTRAAQLRASNDEVGPNGPPTPKQRATLLPTYPSTPPSPKFTRSAL